MSWLNLNTHTHTHTHTHTLTNTLLSAQPVHTLLHRHMLTRHQWDQETVSILFHKLNFWFCTLPRIFWSICKSQPIVVGLARPWRKLRSKCNWVWRWWYGTKKDKRRFRGQDKRTKMADKDALILFHWWSPSGETFGHLRSLILSSKSAFVLFRSLLLSQIKKSYGFSRFNWWYGTMGLHLKLLIHTVGTCVACQCVVFIATGRWVFSSDNILLFPAYIFEKTTTFQPGNSDLLHIFISGCRARKIFSVILAKVEVNGKF